MMIATCLENCNSAPVYFPLLWILGPLRLPYTLMPLVSIERALKSKRDNNTWSHSGLSHLHVVEPADFFKPGRTNTDFSRTPESFQTMFMCLLSSPCMLPSFQHEDCRLLLCLDRCPPHRNLRKTQAAVSLTGVSNNEDDLRCLPNYHQLSVQVAAKSQSRWASANGHRECTPSKLFTDGKGVCI